MTPNLEEPRESHHQINRRPYMSAHVLLNLLNEFGKVINYEACRAFNHFFRNEFNKFINTGARMLDSIYHMTINLLKSHFLRKNS